ncbi:SDR family oxidoreductase [Dactylococcopsis salina]|uniref:Nucleoside-diphosphate sugar epimerase n=1 Tax=Dactylococcopsis salina (strain PCC 8305) TaxID=13035 RepID=K9YRS4_DACS8|nr:SDR family oxidoreductase [Dactylococcopsis salina]AFZ49584.1 putative nucleoside-diphosphate sugar epimerase [Dactylococcopsis salina PCC 8305]
MFLVTGATGQIGRRIIRLLREEEQAARGFVRLDSNYSEIEQRGADIFIGELTEEKDIAKACQDVKYVISAHGSGGNAQALDYRANVDLIDQAKAQGVEHFVYISVLGAQRGYEDSPTFKAKREVEKYLQKSGLNYTILQPSGLASDLIPLAERLRDTGFYLIIGDPKNRTSIVSPDDLAKIAIDAVKIEAAKNQIFPVGGPEVLKREEIPEILGRIFNREPLVVNVPLFVLDGVRDGIGLIDPETQKSLGTLRIISGNEFFCTETEINQLETTFNMKMESLESFITRYLGT